VVFRGKKRFGGKNLTWARFVEREGAFGERKKGGWGKGCKNTSPSPLGKEVLPRGSLRNQLRSGGGKV
jgi:hypothetical protein